MARLAKNASLQGISGKLGNQLVFKQYGDKTVVTQYPDMSRVKPAASKKITVIYLRRRWLMQKD